VPPESRSEARRANRVVATAGHVDHGKSSLIERLTGIDPDRWAEEKRRGLTIDLGYAWCELPSGREVGFVDVPGHERFIRNMLAGVGPVPLVLFVVAADEGWKPGSEEHLEILDVLGVAGGVIALTKRDLVDDDVLAIAEQEVRERVEGTTLVDAPIVPVSAVTGDGVAELRAALDAMVGGAPLPAPGSPRLFVDRVFTIRGAGTVVTGTLTGDRIHPGDEMALEPGDRRVRIRSLQTHERPEEVAVPVSRVAANLVGSERDAIRRGDVLVRPGGWLPTATFDVELRAVRGLPTTHSSRGAFKVHAGAAEVDARVRFLSGTRLEPGGRVFARLRTARPLVLGVGDRFVLREAGRRRTVGGGVVLDLAPGRASTARDRLAARAAAAPDDLPRLLVRERGAVPAADVPRLVGAAPDPSSIVRGWAVDPVVRRAVGEQVTSYLDAFHEEEPLASGASIDQVRRVCRSALRAAGAPTEPALVDAVLDDLATTGAIERDTTTLRRIGHRVSLSEVDHDVRRLLEAVGGDASVSPPSIPELSALGIDRDLVDAAASAGLVVRVSKELVFSPELVARAGSIVRAAPGGITVSEFREALGTTRKYALPLLEHFDRTGVTVRRGDLRFPR
jgi:selenocysteine-specific elongation factor